MSGKQNSKDKPMRNVPNRPHCTEAREPLPRNVWVQLRSKHIWMECECCNNAMNFITDYKYLSHQVLSLVSEVGAWCPLNESNGVETTSETFWRHADDDWQLQSSSGTEGAETHLTRYWCERGKMTRITSYQSDQLWGSQSCHFKSFNSSRISQRSPKWMGTYTEWKLQTRTRNKPGISTKPASSFNRFPKTKSWAQRPRKYSTKWCGKRPNVERRNKTWIRVNPNERCIRGKSMTVQCSVAMHLAVEMTKVELENNSLKKAISDWNTHTLNV